MPKDIIVIGASAGGIEALRAVNWGTAHGFAGVTLRRDAHLAGITRSAG